MQHSVILFSSIISNGRKKNSVTTAGGSLLISKWRVLLLMEFRFTPINIHGMWSPIFYHDFRAAKAPFPLTGQTFVRFRMYRQVFHSEHPDELALEALDAYVTFVMQAGSGSTGAWYTARFGSVLGVAASHMSLRVGLQYFYLWRFTAYLADSRR